MNRIGIVIVIITGLVVSGLNLSLWRLFLSLFRFSCHALPCTALSGLVSSISLIHCGNLFRNPVPVRTLVVALVILIWGF